MVDCGADWLGTLDEIAPHAIVLTHAHPDHAWGLKNGAPCPVYATQATWRDMRAYPIPQRRAIAPRQPVQIQGITFAAFSVEHSTRCPAVVYRITAGRVSVVYAPDVAYIPERTEALSGAAIYIGDGATLARPMIRKRGEHLIGHAPIRTQLSWCAKEGVPRAIFTHCGSQIVAGDESAAIEQVRGMGAQRGVDAELAYDGMIRVLR
jgi:phosphoribosyl 1,2-cyclic phosphodiesterase